MNILQLNHLLNSTWFHFQALRHLSEVELIVCRTSKVFYFFLLFTASPEFTQSHASCDLTITQTTWTNLTGDESLEAEDVGWGLDGAENIGQEGERGEVGLGEVALTDTYTKKCAI